MAQTAIKEKQNINQFKLSFNNSVVVMWNKECLPVLRVLTNTHHTSETGCFTRSEDITHRKIQTDMVSYR